MRLWLLALLVTLLVPTAAAAEGTAPTSGSAGNSAPQKFVHPKRNYTLFAPSGTIMKDKGGGIDVSIQSPRGYAITLQSGDAKPEINLASMTAKLEALYLGKGKSWNTKLSERPLTIAGLAAHETVYEGSGSRSRVVILRGRVTDFVFIFFAPPRDFITHEREFEWVLNNFHPGADEIQSNSKIPASTTPAAPMQRFNDPGGAYSMDYPVDWVVDRSTANSVLFSGRDGTEAYYAVVSIRNVIEPSAAQALSGLKAQISAAATGIKYITEGTFRYDYNGLPVEGREFTASYDLKGQRFRKWALVAPRPAGGTVHIWSYTTPADSFERFLAIAKVMRGSWRIDSRR